MAGEPLPWWERPRTQQEERPTKTEELAPIEIGHLLNRAYHAGIDVLERLFGEAEAALWATLCRHRLPDGSPRFVKHGTRARTYVTRMGRLSAPRPHDQRDCDPHHGCGGNPPNHVVAGVPR